MKQVVRPGLLSLLAVLSMAAMSRPAQAATASLSDFVIGHSIGEAISVTLTSASSFWKHVDFHCNGPGTETRTISRDLGPFYGPGTFGYPGLNDPAVQWDNLPSGTYDLYAIASGSDTSTLPWTTWYASTGEKWVTIP
ncbi:MAG TPA: hypothetical protein VFB38_07390 [Chthonomonadaceae bacterium]|nr:hypothetical protein [Chthonomonadaceae bacterium]